MIALLPSAQGVRDLIARRQVVAKLMELIIDFKFKYLPHFASNTPAFEFNDSLAPSGHLSDPFSCLR
jgi:hypothetical protein